MKIAAIDKSADSERQVRGHDPKGSPELLAAIDKALSDIKADGTYKKISQKYFGKDVSK